jgi:hypothetical protein
MRDTPLVRKPPEREEGALRLPEALAKLTQLDDETMLRRLADGKPMPPLPVARITHLGILIAERLDAGSEWDKLKLLIPIAHSSRPIAEVAVMHAERMNHPTELEVGTLLDRSGKIVTSRGEAESKVEKAMRDG